MHMSDSTWWGDLAQRLKRPALSENYNLSRGSTMSVRGNSKKSPPQQLAACAGEFAVLKEYLAEKEKPVWMVFQLLDALLRGFGQVVFANNPISGLLIAVSLAATASGTLVFCATTAFLGLLLSVLMQDSQHNITNGLTVFNPLLVGAASFALIPKVYGAFDAFSILLVLLGTIFSVYLTRSLGNSKSPCMVWPFLLAEFALLLALSTQNNGAESTRVLQTIREMNNATSDATRDDVSFIGENVTNVYIDWGMVFHGIVVSASQVFAVNSVAAGAVVYLAVLLFSPRTAGFAFLGALISSLAGLQLGVELNEVYSGVWGFNGFLTGASLGGTFLRLNGQAAAATLVAIVYTAIVQYSMVFLFKKVELPVLTLPFVLVTTLFVRLRNNPENDTFSCPTSVPFPEKQRQNYLASRRELAKQIDDLDESEGDIEKNQRGSSVVNV